MNKTIVVLLAAIVIAAPAWAAKRKPRAKYRIKIATIAPEGTSWVRSFKEMSDEILALTDGNVKFLVYPGQVLGEEKDVLYKIRVGQVQGGGFLGLGISRVCPDARALMLPLLFENYAEVDAVFENMLPYLEQQCIKNGFVALGWTEVGFSYILSTVPVRGAADVRGAKPWMMTGDHIMNELFRAGNISGIPVPVGDVLTALQTGLIKTVFTPPYPAIAAQWFTRINYRNDLRLTYSFGGIFVSTKAWNKIPAKWHGPILAITHRSMTELTQKIRKDNVTSLNIMAKNEIRVVTPTEQDKKEYKQISAKALAALKGTLFSPNAYEMVTKYLAEHRRGAAN